MVRADETGEPGATVAKKAKVDKKWPFRGSMFIYENSLGLRQLDAGADLTQNEYYAMSLSFRPRWYLRDDLNLRARMDLEIELTDSDSTDTAREWAVSDLSLEANYGPKWMKIPFVGITVNPSLRVYFPTSKVSRGRSMVMSFAPGVALRRKFDLLKGDWLSDVTLTYGFRATKYWHEYQEASVSSLTGCISSNRPECQHRGKRNRDWRLVNTFAAKVQVWKKLSFAMTLMVINDVLYELPETSAGTAATGDNKTVAASEINHRGALWGVIDVSYDVFDWLSLSLGLSTFHPQLLPDSSGYYGPFFNRYATAYFDVAIPIDKAVDQVQSWTGWGQGNIEDEGKL